MTWPLFWHGAIYVVSAAVIVGAVVDTVRTGRRERRARGRAGAHGGPGGLSQVGVTTALLLPPTDPDPRTAVRIP
jgi:hypothetical protein